MRILLAFALLIGLTQCKNDRKIPENFDYGKVTNGVYQNAYFNFEMPVPNGWSVQNKQQVDQLKEMGRDMIGEKNKELAEQVKAGEVRTAYLFTAFERPIDSATGEFNPSIMIMAENIAGANHVKDGSDYLRETKKAIERSNMGQEIDPTIHNVKVDGKPFGILETITPAGEGLKVHQEYYAHVQKGFAMTMILTYLTEAQGEQLKKIVNTINFR